MGGCLGIIMTEQLSTLFEDGLKQLITRLYFTPLFLDDFGVEISLHARDKQDVAEHAFSAVFVENAEVKFRGVAHSNVRDRCMGIMTFFIKALDCPRLGFSNGVTHGLVHV